MDLGNIRVGVLEDQRLARECICDLLAQRGVNIVAASASSPDFLGRMLPVEPHVVLVDLYLGGAEGRSEGGLDAIRTLRERHPNVAVVAMTGSATPEEMDASMREGAVACLDKNRAGPDLIVSTVHAAANMQPLERFAVPVTPARSGSPLSSLTAREVQVLRHLATGADNLKIAALLAITERTVRAHVSSLYRKLGCENRTEMAVLARRLGVRPEVEG